MNIEQHRMEIIRNDKGRPHIYKHNGKWEMVCYGSLFDNKENPRYVKNRAIIKSWNERLTE